MPIPAEPRLADFLRRVNAILADHPAFRHGDNCEFIDNNHPAIIAAYRHDPATPGGGFLVACNFDTQNPQHISIDLQPLLPSPLSPACRDLLSGQIQRIPVGPLDYNFPRAATRCCSSDWP